MEERYQIFLDHVFNHPKSEEAWFWDVDAPVFEASPEEIATLVALVFQRSGKDLLKFSDHQVNNGLKYILDSSCNDMDGIIRDGDFSLDVKLHVIRSMWLLYKECFAKRCPPVLGHISEPSNSELSYICYMLWDVSSLSYWPRAGKEEAYPEIVNLLEKVLGIENDACIESALHGLGHIHAYSPEAVEEVVDRFLANATGTRKELYEYAKSARVGHVL